MKWPGIHRNVRWAILPSLVLVVAACAGSATRGPVTESFARGRFTVKFSAQAVAKASAGGVSLPQVVGRALGRINTLLPGPPTTITVSYNSSPVIPQTGTDGFTSEGTGAITIWFRPTPQASFRRIMQLWLARTLSHEVDHSVRILAGPGFGLSLLAVIISEGISSAFDGAAFPGAADPWDRAISPTQECALWKQAQPLLAQDFLYDAWMFGQPGIPHWTGFTIGYDIVADYRHRHPDTSWSAITAASPVTILAGSDYQPCPS